MTMTSRAGRAAAIAAFVGLLAGCGTSELFGTYDLPESADVAGAPWPRLVDTPTPPPAGSYGPGVPDPAGGRAVAAALGAEAAVAAARADALAAPVLSDAERRRLGKPR